MSAGTLLAPCRREVTVARSTAKSRNDSCFIFSAPFLLGPASYASHHSTTMSSNATTFHVLVNWTQFAGGSERFAAVIASGRNSRPYVRRFERWRRRRPWQTAMTIAGLPRGRSFGRGHSGAPGDSPDAMRRLPGEPGLVRERQVSQALKPIPGRAHA